MAVYKIPTTNQRQELIPLVALPLLAASLPPINASNAGRRQGLSYFGFSTVEGYHCLVFAGRIERNGCGNHRHSDDDPKHDLLFHNRLPEAPAVDRVADGCTEVNPTPPNPQLANGATGRLVLDTQQPRFWDLRPASKRWPDVRYWQHLAALFECPLLRRFGEADIKRAPIRAIQFMMGGLPPPTASMCKSGEC